MVIVAFGERKYFNRNFYTCVARALSLACKKKQRKQLIVIFVLPPWKPLQMPPTRAVKNLDIFHISPCVDEQICSLAYFTTSIFLLSYQKR